MVKYMESTAQKAKLKSFSPAYFTPAFSFNWGGWGGVGWGLGGPPSIPSISKLEYTDLNLLIIPNI